MQLIGSIVSYPFKWTVDEPEDPQPKARCCCLLLEIGRGKKRDVLIVPISDRASKNSLAMTNSERRRAGLSEFRAAFIHVDVYNMDRAAGSYHYNPAVLPIGKLPKALLSRVAKDLAARIRSGEARRIERT